MKKVIILNKNEGETPLECLGRFRNRGKKYQNIKMTYAGRLDPMASGLLLILAGDEVKNKEKYFKLSKEYEFEILFGFATDTYDILGKPARTTVQSGGVTDSEVRGPREEELKKIIKNNLKYFTGKFNQTYPLYSSVNIKKVRAGLDVKSTSKQINVNSLKLIKIKSISAKLLLINIEKRIKKVGGDFRQKEIIKMWREKLSKNSGKYCIASFKIECGGGTYVRGIADSLGRRIGVPALAFSIQRTKIGKWAK